MFLYLLCSEVFFVLPKFLLWHFFPIWLIEAMHLFSISCLSKYDVFLYYYFYILHFKWKNALIQWSDRLVLFSIFASCSSFHSFSFFFLWFMSLSQFCSCIHGLMCFHVCGSAHRNSHGLCPAHLCAGNRTLEVPGTRWWKDQGVVKKH